MNESIPKIGCVVGESYYLLGSVGGIVLDVETAEFIGIANLKPGTKTHQILEILSRDFYRPVRIGTLFSELFPGEYFDINSSPSRVHQILYRARLWSESEELPFSINERHGNYRLEITGSFAVKVPLEHKAVDANAVYLMRLVQVFPNGRIFTAREARQAIQMSLTSFNRFINAYVAEGKIKRIGGGPNTKYAIVSEAASNVQFRAA